LAAWYAQQEKMPDNGNYTIIGGLSFQAFTLLVFLCLSTNFGIRSVKAYRRHGSSALSEDPNARKLRQSKRFKLLIFSLAFSAVLIFMRSIYRVIELSEGWKGPLMTTEKFVMWLEAIPVAVSGFFLSLVHPANCFRDEDPAEENMELRDTPPSAGSVAPQGYDTATDDSEKDRNNSRYGSVVVKMDNTFDRKNWR